MVLFERDVYVGCKEIFINFGIVHLSLTITLNEMFNKYWYHQQLIGIYFNL